jgi:cephalosporin-C deacetylase-like acetyl esterase
MKEWFVSDLEHSLVGTTHDVQMVLNYLAQRGEFDLSRVGMFGEGSGGTIALLAASVDRRIKAVDVLNPWGDWPAWLGASLLVPAAERSDYLKPAFLASVAPLDPVTVLPKLTHLPLRLQQNMWDDTTTPTNSREGIAAALPVNASLAQYRDEQDYFEKVGNNGKMLDWMYAHLPSSTQQNTSPKQKP